MLCVRFSSFLRTKSYSTSLAPLSFSLSLCILFVHLGKGFGLHQSFGCHDWCCTIMCEQIPLQMLALNYLRYIPRMEFLYHTIILLLMSWGLSILFSPAALPLCFSTRSPEGLSFAHVHTSIFAFLLFIISNSHLNRSDACSGLIHSRGGFCWMTTMFVIDLRQFTHCVYKSAWLSWAEYCSPVFHVPRMEQPVEYVDSSPKHQWDNVVCCLAASALESDELGFCFRLWSYLLCVHVVNLSSIFLNTVVGNSNFSVWL